MHAAFSPFQCAFDDRLALVWLEIAYLALSDRNFVSSWNLCAAILFRFSSFYAARGSLLSEAVDIFRSWEGKAMNFVRRLKSERLASVLEETIRQENEGQSLIRIFRALANQVSFSFFVISPDLSIANRRGQDATRWLFPETHFQYYICDSCECWTVVGNIFTVRKLESRVLAVYSQENFRRNDCEIFTYDVGIIWHYSWL